MKHIDPVSKQELEVRSVVYPTKTLLQGCKYNPFNLPIPAAKKLTREQKIRSPQHGR